MFCGRNTPATFITLLYKFPQDVSGLKMMFLVIVGFPYFVPQVVIEAVIVSLLDYLVILHLHLPIRRCFPEYCTDGNDWLLGGGYKEYLSILIWSSSDGNEDVLGARRDLVNLMM